MALDAFIVSISSERKTTEPVRAPWLFTTALETWGTLDEGWGVC